MAPPRTTVRNADILQAIDAHAQQQQQRIDALSRQVQSRDEPLEARLDEMTVTMMDWGRRQDALEKMVTAALTKEAKRDTCPFRDDIVTGANHKRRIEAVEKGVEEARGAIHKVELKIAGWSVLGGGAISAIVAVADRIIEAVRASGGA